MSGKKPSRFFRRCLSITGSALLLGLVAFTGGVSGHAISALGEARPSQLALPVDSVSAEVPVVTLHFFAGAPTDGSTPYSPVIRDVTGNLHGTTYWGGASNNGAIYKTVPSSKNTTILYSLNGGADGAGPYSGLIQDADGNFYGTTVGGGQYGLGVLFLWNVKIGKETILGSFTSDTSGAYPYGGLVIDSAGNIYGTASYGGKGTCTLNGNKGCGTVFEVTPSNGSFTRKILYNFTGQKVSGDGAVPMGTLVVDPQGNLYGTTSLGGLHNFGTVFKIDTSGKETVIHNFGAGTDGKYPMAGLIRDQAGNLYGTTYYGGIHTMGAVFKIDTAGAESVVYSFAPGADGQNPAASLLRDGSGNLYGTTQYGGDLSCTILPNFGCGTVFKVDANGAETILHKFTANGDGAFPTSALIANGQGSVFGTTTADGSNSMATFGTVFEISTSQ